MSSGTPVIAYARGSAPEIIADGETGFLVNPSEEDKRGQWIVASSGVPGLCEGVRRLYAMSAGDYRKMRQACRERVLKYFTIGRMIQEYVALYERIAGHGKTRS